MNEINKEWQLFCPYFESIKGNREIPETTKDKLIFHAGAFSMLKVIFKDGLNEEEVKSIIKEHARYLDHHLGIYSR